MFKKTKEYISNIYTVIFKREKKDLVKFFLISTPGSLAAFLEGLTFGLLLCALYVLNGNGIEAFNGRPILSRIARIAHLENFTTNELFLIMIIAAIGAQILKALTIYLSDLQAAKLNARISAQIHANIYEHILSFNFQTVSGYKAGGLAAYTQIPSAAIIPMLQSFHKIIVQGCVMGILLLFMFKVSTPLSLFFLAFFISSAFAYKKIIRTITKYSEKCANQLLKFSNDVVQAINGIKLIHVFGMQNVILRRSRSVMEKMQEFQKGSAQLQSLLVAVGEVFSMIMMAATLAISSSFLVISHERSLPLLLTYIAIAYRFTGTSKEVLNHFAVIANQAGSIMKLNDILKTDDKGFEPTTGVEAKPMKKGIKLANVSFKYPLKKQRALDRVTLDFPKGKMTAIVGLSGAGKSSMINLITRLFDPITGKILVDGVNINEYNIKSWRSKLGVVTQNAIIFNDPARENICFGTDASDEEVLEACRVAGCHEVIKNLPAGLDSPLGDHGYRISGGEAQRIAIARALIRKPEVLIMDEATSNLDSHNEQIIHETMEKFRKACTLIVIAHRLSTIVSADKIVVLSDGKVIESGTHEELLENEGRYAYLWNLQSKTNQSSEVFV